MSYQVVHHFLDQLKRSSGTTTCVLIAVFITASAHGQYFQFSQYNFTDQRVNPATIGTTSYASVDGDYRNQKTGGDFNLNSSFLSASYPFLNRSTGRPWSGVGVSLVDDRSSGIFKTQEIAIAYAVNVRLTRYSLLSVGLRGLYQAQRIGLDGLFTGSQYIPDRGFSGASSGENFQNLRTSYKSLGTGVYYQQTDKKGAITGYWGFSLFDINRPAVSFLGNDATRSPSAVFTGGFLAIKAPGLNLFPEMLYTYSASNHVLNIGARFQHEIDPKPKKVSDRVDVITKYVIGRSGIIGVQFHRENFSFGVSYDFPVIRRNVGNVGALEVGLSLRRLVIPPARRKAIARKKQEDLRKHALAKNAAKKQMTKTTAKTDSLKTAAKPNEVPKNADAVVPQPIPEVQIVKTDSAEIKSKAVAGKLSQEPLIVEKVTLHFHFEFNSVDLDEETEQFLEDLTVTLKSDERLKLRVTGHTDNIGNAKFNEKLSVKRAEVVRGYLIKKGISPDRLIADGKGMSVPLNDNSTEDERALNRRVELIVYY